VVSILPKRDQHARGVEKRAVVLGLVVIAGDEQVDPAVLEGFPE
jgi:hypothetical protein